MNRLPLKSIYNTRELGGYFTNENKMTQYKRFIRSDAFTAIEEDDKKYLLDYGVRVVIDLRDAFEIEMKPNTFADEPGVAYYNIQVRDYEEPTMDPNMIDLQQMYIDIINKSKGLSNVFKTMAKEADEGIIAFHCTAGKDRAGLVAAMLLMIAGVNKRDIIANYQVSHTYITPIIEELFKIYPSYPMHVMKSEPEWINNAVEHIEKNYGGIEKYLIFKGVTKEEIETLKAKLTDEKA